MKTSNKTISPWFWVPTLYFAEGVPYFVVNNISVMMFTKMGVPNGDMAFFTTLLYFPWFLKGLWGPLVDVVKTKRWWILSMQVLMTALMILLTVTLPKPDVATIASGQTPISMFTITLILFIIAAFASATHDIAADGYYMLALPQKEQSFFVGIRTTVYRIAMIIGQGGLVAVAGWMEMSLPDGNAGTPWMVVSAILSGLFVLLALWHTLALPRATDDKAERRISTIGRALKEFGHIFASFFKKRHVTTALLFMLLYRFPEAMLVKLISPFLLDSPEVGGLGLSTSEVGICYGTVGMAALMLGGIAGGIVVSRGGLARWMRPMAWSMSLTCGVFVYLSMAGTVSVPVIYGCVALEQAGYGFGATAYTMYLIFYSQGPNKTAHYAICTGIMALGMMLPGMMAGMVQEMLGYELFFWVVMFCCALTIGMAMIAKVPENFGRKM